MQHPIDDSVVEMIIDVSLFLELKFFLKVLPHPEFQGTACLEH